MDKYFSVIQHLAAGSGFKVFVVKARSIEDAFDRYAKATNYKGPPNLNIEEIRFTVFATGDVSLILEYDNPSYEG